MNMIEEIAASDKRRLDEMGKVAREVAQAKAELQSEKAALEANRAELAVKQAELDAKAAEAQELLKQLIARGEEYDKLMDEQEQLLSEMEQQIAGKQEEYDDALYQEWLATSVPPTTKPPVIVGGGTGGSAVDFEGLTWLVPCNYKYVSSPFGYRWHPVHGDWRFHAGVDLAIGCTPIYATRQGVVVTAQYSSSAGYYVVIDHGDGFKSTYMHMCRFPDVKVGQFVSAGQVIGCVGSTGWSTGSHLHFGISYQGVAMNPMDFIS
jgi:murein DD-endopeptidase MepM/ murein hydrolase activator NlpD